MQLIYNFFFFFFALFYLPFFILKGKHKQGFSERLGIISEETKKRLEGKKVFWVHAVSVGEVMQAVRFVDALRTRLPGHVFVLTATTAAGYQTACRLKKPEDTVLYFPIDFRICVRSFIKNIHPRALVILETEIWPNLIWELSKNKIPVFIINGRISDKALARYRYFKFFFKSLLNLFETIAAQDQEMKSRFYRLGAQEQRVAVTGSMKYDWRPAFDAKNVQKSATFLFVAGSTHEGEEEILIDCYLSLRKKHPLLRLLIVPRHLDRLRNIEQKILKRDLKMFAISSGDWRQVSGNETIFVLDQMGVLADWYRIADVVFVGGSLVPVGGHNLVEPAFFEKPILFGPHTHNFKEMTREFKQHNAGLEVKDGEDLEKILCRLMEDPVQRRALGTEAKKLISRHEGAAQKNAELVTRNFLK